jgi:hypothetical protein
VGADDLLCLLKHLIEGEGGGIEDDGIESGAEGRLGTVAIAFVAFFHLVEDLQLGS